MSLAIAVEDAGWELVPGLEGLARRAAAAAFAGAQVDEAGYETAILFTGDAAMAGLNRQWRGQDKPTNVLSFPAPDSLHVPDGEPRPLGDIALALGVIAREAEDQGKPLPHHLTHLMIHGILHLLGYDHETEEQAAEMESLETGILKGLGIPDPYERH